MANFNKIQPFPVVRRASVNQLLGANPYCKWVRHNGVFVWVCRTDMGGGNRPGGNFPRLMYGNETPGSENAGRANKPAPSNQTNNNNEYAPTQNNDAGMNSGAFDGILQFLDENKLYLGIGLAAVAAIVLLSKKKGR